MYMVDIRYRQRYKQLTYGDLGLRLRARIIIRVGRVNCPCDRVIDQCIVIKYGCRNIVEQHILILFTNLRNIARRKGEDPTDVDTPPDGVIDDRSEVALKPLSNHPPGEVCGRKLAELGYMVIDRLTQLLIMLLELLLELLDDLLVIAAP